MKTNNLQVILDRIKNHTLDKELKAEKEKKKEGGKSTSKVFNTDMTLMSPIKPMLAKLEIVNQF
jgi:hypothetical protein